MISAPPRKPLPCPQEPTPRGEDADDTQGDGGVVQCLDLDGIDGWQTESDGDEGDPERGYQSDRVGGTAEFERAAVEVLGIGEGHGDGDAVGYVEGYCGDGGGAVEGDLGAESLEGEEEGAGGAEDDGADG